jgi:hypothetical protein
MSQKAKMGYVETGNAITDQTGAKKPDAKAPAFAPEPAATKLPPPDDAMVQQILERQAVFGF